MRFGSKVKRAAVWGLGGSLLAASAGVAVLGGSAVAGAAGTAVTVTENCTLPLSTGTTAVTVTDTVTAPSSVGTSTPITFGQSLSFIMPAALVSGEKTWGGTGVTVDSLSNVTNTTGGVQPASETANISGIFNETNAQLASPLTIPLINDSFVSGLSAGTETFKAGNLSFYVIVAGGVLNGQSYSITCTVGSPAPTLATITVGTVSKSNQTITVTSVAPTTAVVGGSTYTPTASSTSGLAVTTTVDSTSTSVCTISSGAVSFIAPGTCTLDFNQVGNSTYNAASQVQQSFTVKAKVLGPIGAIGGVALAGVAGLGFVVVQRRRARRFTKAS